MKVAYQHSSLLKYIFVAIASLIVVVSVLFTHRLGQRLEEEEKRKIEIWAEATRQFILADENTDIDFVSSIIEGNTTIPVYMVNADDSVLFSRNVKLPKTNVQQFYKEKVAHLKTTTLPIEVRIDASVVQYIYYDDSVLLRQLYLFPYLQFGIIFVFGLIVLLAFTSIKRSEQNRVWVGLSRETAHQLGTPISSLLAWGELLKATYPDDTLLPEMNKDVNRLRVIADRFSKIGSQPDLTLESLNEVLGNAVNYMQNRTSNKVEFSLSYLEMQDAIFAPLNVPLFEWVIENLCKNAIDAMNGQGSIQIEVSQVAKYIQIDVTDTGKGMERSRYKTIFKPGFTTKRRGWGLGLSLTKRIVEEYHGGKIFVLRSELGRGTTFRILLKTA